MMPNNEPNFNSTRGTMITRVNYENSVFRLRAGKPHVLTWKEKIYLRRLRRNQSQARIARELETHPASISAALGKAMKRFNVTTIDELLALSEVQRQLDAED